MRARAVWVTALLLAAPFARADGGRIRLKQDAGSFAVSVFTAPDPLVAGPADLSVLVQERASGDVVLDADVEVRLRTADGERTLSYSTAAGRNRLLRQATVEFPSAGRWELEVAVRRGAEEATVSGVLPVEPPRSRAAAPWPYLAAPPIAVALYAIGGALTRRRRRGP